MCLLYHLLPLEIACYGNDDIQSVETSLEGYAFYDIQVAAYYIDDDPEEPLLDVLACQGPQTHKAQGVGETVEKWRTKSAEKWRTKVRREVRFEKPREGYKHLRSAARRSREKAQSI